MCISSATKHMLAVLGSVVRTGRVKVTTWTVVGWQAESSLRDCPQSVQSGQRQQEDTFTVCSSMKAPVMWLMPLQRKGHLTVLLIHHEQR